jgi:hypothetical protein
MRHRRGNGERMGNIQFGYRLSSDGRHVEQAVVDEINRLRLNGHTLRGIAPALNHRVARVVNRGELQTKGLIEKTCMGSKSSEPVPLLQNRV